jgi:hypothetical protein
MDPHLAIALVIVFADGVAMSIALLIAIAVAMRDR